MSSFRKDANQSFCSEINKQRKKKSRLVIIISTLAFILQPVAALKFTSIQMPALVQRATNFWLACQYELSSVDDSLYSVKWYKNNEEFYRILFNSQTGQSATPSPSDTLELSGNSFQQQSTAPSVGHFQQQYFTQAGVNVLMSSSNATHVRLLNASLDSEGAYACEISTENLSTIRHEREIKVYVLPHSKLNVTGLRSAYALNDQVELNCQADASRPIGSLAWFINNRRITANSRPFELIATQQTKLTSGGDKMARATLWLKFKLTSEILLGTQSRPAAATTTTTNSAADNQNARRNQSRASGGDMTQPLPPLRLECKFKLADVSDVTFNELKVARIDSPSPLQDDNLGAGAAQASYASSTAAEVVQYHRRRARRAYNHNNRFVRLSLTKSHGSQIVQSTCPARRAHFAISSSSSSRPSDVACQLAPNSLQLDDPIIMESQEGEAEVEDQQDGDDKSATFDYPQAAHLELPEGALLTLNCTTLGAIIHDERATGGASNWPLGPSRRVPHHLADEANRAPPPPTIDYCTDPMSRRRALISGKHQTSAANNERRGQRTHQIAYVMLDGAAATTTASDYDSSRLRGRPQGDNNFGAAAELAQTSASGVTKSSAQLDSWQQQQQSDQLLAPPLLEWFINNQEAPKSSVSYSPGLPLTLARLPESLENRAPGGATRRATAQSQYRGSQPVEEPQLPSIDYAEYFANFQPSVRPIDQHLKLSLKLDKRHFMTPDSMLTLRCTSTQAQLLVSDSVIINFVAAPPSQQADGARQNHYHGGGGGGGGGFGWQQRPMNSTANSQQQQIRQKYLHQYPRSSSQKFSSPSGLNGGGGSSGLVATNQLASKSSAAAAAATSIPSSCHLVVLCASLVTTLLLMSITAN